MKIIAHRGASHDAPENTLKAFNFALDEGVDGIELDVRLCATGEVVVIHDDTVNRTTSGKGRVRDISLEALQELDAGDGETISTLEEVLREFAGRTRFFIEVKEAAAMLPAAELVSRLVDAKSYAPEQLVIISFLHSELAAANRVNATIPLGIGLSKHPYRLEDLARYTKARYATVEYSLITPAFLKEAGLLGLSVYAWTVNNPIEAVHLQQLDVAGLITDEPARIKLSLAHD